jgi:uncharacterized protein
LANNTDPRPLKNIIAKGDILAVYNDIDLSLRVFRKQVKINNSIPWPKDIEILANPEYDSCADHQEGLLRDTLNADERQPPLLRKLSLVVSNKCNMACTYCYAKGGLYYTDGLMMDEMTALRALNFVRRNYSGVEHINFFGGEPTMNFPIIKLVCEYAGYLYDRGLLTMLPRFGITTNGYVLEGNVLDFLRNYNFSVCISLDGPEEIHDRLRVTKARAGTYSAVADTIHRMQDYGIMPEFECTYTAEHDRNGLDVKALIDFFAENFRCRTLHCPPVITEPGNTLSLSIDRAAELYAEAVAYSIRNLGQGISRSLSVANRLLISLASRRPQYYYCPAGGRSLTINADGALFACFMIMDEAALSFGNVNDEVRQFHGYPAPLRDILHQSNKWHNPACRDCWALSLCFGCIGEDRAYKTTRSSVPGASPWCDFRRKVRESFLTAVAEVIVSATSPQGQRHD